MSRKVLHNTSLLSWHCSSFLCHMILSAWKNLKRNEIFGLWNLSYNHDRVLILPNPIYYNVPTKGCYWGQLSKANLTQAHLPTPEPHPRHLFIQRSRTTSVSAWVSRPPILQVTPFIRSPLFTDIASGQAEAQQPHLSLGSAQPAPWRLNGSLPLYPASPCSLHACSRTPSTTSG